ncbi:MAG: phosphate signaling complex protein PhoU [Candidatus Bathyarchaeota archaeon]|nr:phosphate signaling complex protein PhoU [Candidatus Bathyarchaeota archaeon]
MSRIIDTGLEELSVMLCRMGELTYETVSLSIKGCLNGTSVYSQIHEMSDVLVSMSDQAEDKAFELIARFQPVASDLRTIKSYMKIAYDFARYSRYALDIAYINEQLGGLKECEKWISEYIEKMSEKVLNMVRTSIDALRSHDTQLAKTIAKTEETVDKMYFEYLNKLIEEAPATSKCTISSVLIVRYLERIADHATYICESVIYLATGEKTTLR